MNFFDDESEIVQWLQKGTLYKCAFPYNSYDAVTVFEAVHDREKWKNGKIVLENLILLPISIVKNSD